MTFLYSVLLCTLLLRVLFSYLSASLFALTVWHFVAEYFYCTSCWRTSKFFTFFSTSDLLCCLKSAACIFSGYFLPYISIVDDLKLNYIEETSEMIPGFLLWGIIRRCFCGGWTGRLPLGRERCSGQVLRWLSIRKWAEALLTNRVQD